MKLKYVHWDNFRFLTGLDKPFARATNGILSEFDAQWGGAVTALIKAMKSAVGGQVNIEPGSLMVQYDLDSREYGFRFESFLQKEYEEGLAQGRDRYSEQGGMPWTICFVLKRGEERVMIDLPMASVLQGRPDISGFYQIYAHSFVHDETGSNIGDGCTYIGVTKRGWKVRWSEHLRSADRGSRYRFHQAIRHWTGKARTVSHNVIACGLTEPEAMAMEEHLVGLETLYPKGLNMIPGGYAGMKYLRQIGAVGSNEPVNPDDKQDIVNRFFETASRKGLPNPLAAANWCDPSYAEKVICAGDDRLKPDQIRTARFLSSLGKSTDDIVSEIGARNKPQVQRLLAGSTYSRIA